MAETKVFCAVMILGVKQYERSFMDLFRDITDLFHDNLGGCRRVFREKGN